LGSGSVFGALAQPAITAQASATGNIFSFSIFTFK
jgi:hypothetical protein